MSKAKKQGTFGQGEPTKKSHADASSSMHAKLAQAIIKASGVIQGESAPPATFPKLLMPIVRQVTSKSKVIQEPVESSLNDANTDACREAAEVLEPLIDTATARAERLAQFLNCLAAKLDRIGCKPSEVEGYLRAERQCLASLYLEARQSHPSPLTLKQLALRYALDARKPIAKDIRQYQVRRVQTRWEITECPTVTAANNGLPPLPGVPVTDLYSVRMMDLVYTEADPSPGLVELIETVFGRVPAEVDAFQPIKPEIRYLVERSSRTVATVRLWVGDREVKLPPWDGVHNLLAVLFEFPDRAIKGENLRSERISNPSKACKMIRSALESAAPGAGAWLETKPIRWRNGVTLVERQGNNEK